MSDETTDEPTSDPAEAEEAPTGEVAEQELVELPDHPVLASLARAVPASRFEERFGQQVAVVAREDLVAFAAAALAAGFNSCMDLTAVDYLRRRPRFELVVVLLSHEHGLRLRVLVPVPAADPVVPTLTTTYPGADFYEREVFDMFGIRFEGHDDLTRILLPDDWEGHPLRKDYPVGSVPVQFKSSPKAT